MKDFAVRVTITVTPKDRTDDFVVTAEPGKRDRVTITEISRNSTTGTIVIDVRGKKKSNAKNDVTIEAVLDGHTCGSMKATVIIPESICGPCPSTTPATGNCPQGSQREAKNLVMDAASSPAYFGTLEPDEVKLATVWIQWMTIEVCDQLGDPLDAMYAGCCVEEKVDGEWRSINQTMSDQGTYQDPVFWTEQPSMPIVERDSERADNWDDESPEEMETPGTNTQNIPVRICGHQVGHTARKVMHHPSNCVWVECPDGFIIV